MDIAKFIEEKLIDCINDLYNAKIDRSLIQLQKTKKEFIGDLTLVVFPLLKISKKSPDVTANEIGSYLIQHTPHLLEFNVIKGYLNLVISSAHWIELLDEITQQKNYGIVSTGAAQRTVMVEYSSPNTNKPLHLGHVRNNLLGFSVSRILEAAGNKVVKVNLVNDRGIHICKSMLAWQKWGNGITPESSNIKGDHLVGDFYVKFDQEYKKEIAELINKGMSEEEAAKQAPVIIEAQEMLRKWEAKDPEIIALWEKMNNWVYQGFDVTYRTMGVHFDKTYYESQTYLLGKSIVQEGLNKGVLYQREDGSVWADLTADGLDEKLLLRSDGTSVYMTQDLGTAQQRFSEFPIESLIYVVGNEQNYHFQVLSLILQKLGYAWAKDLVHLSYGMVELPSGKMKSREGTVVDADDLMEEMIETARKMSQELGKLEGILEEDKENIIRIIGLGALKYFILKVDPKKNMTFNPAESIDFNGNTGPFVQYTHARIRSVLRKADAMNYSYIEPCPANLDINAQEILLIKLLNEFPSVVKDAAGTFNPALIANYVYDVVKEFNLFYHDYSILKESNTGLRAFRLKLSEMTCNVIKNSLWLLGINVPDRM
jgi:arginyl-tRNA synthetase